MSHLFIASSEIASSNLEAAKFQKTELRIKKIERLRHIWWLSLWILSSSRLDFCHLCQLSGMGWTRGTSREKEREAWWQGLPSQVRDHWGTDTSYLMHSPRNGCDPACWRLDGTQDKVWVTCKRTEHEVAVKTHSVSCFSEYETSLVTQADQNRLSLCRDKDWSVPGSDNNSRNKWYTESPPFLFGLFCPYIVS